MKRGVSELSVLDESSKPSVSGALSPSCFYRKPSLTPESRHHQLPPPPPSCRARLLETMKIGIEIPPRCTIAMQRFARKSPREMERKRSGSRERKRFRADARVGDDLGGIDTARGENVSSWRVGPR